MTNRALRISTALCMTLAVVQLPPVPAVAAPQTSCDPHDPSCKPPPRRSGAKKADRRHPQARHDRARPPQHAPPQHHKDHPPHHQAEHQDQSQHKRRSETQPQARPQNQAQPQSRQRPQARPQQQMPLAQPRPAPQPSTRTHTDQTHADQPRADHAQAQQIQAQPQAERRVHHIGRSDVPRSSDYSYRHHLGKSGGGEDFAKFGLALLAGAVIGQVLNHGDRVVHNYGNRVVYRTPRGTYGLYHDPNTLLRRPGATVTTRRARDGTVLTRVEEPDGLVILTRTDPYGRILSRRFYRPGQRPWILFGGVNATPAQTIGRLPPPSPVDLVLSAQTGPAVLQRTFEIRPLQSPGRNFSLGQILQNRAVRDLVPEVELGTLNFASGSAAVTPARARSLAPLGRAMHRMIARDPAEVFLIEGHTDTTGGAAQNLALSDARAEATALALTENYGVPPQNLIVQGYGEADLKVPVQGPDQINRRVIVRRITPLLPRARRGTVQN